ncbi:MULTISPECIES: ABC transporter substrate-binding protein [unclassified Chelatococcus]|uniref:ABC transporter substrate-binding protein n=1 Tax=unclassified Chelatococcus TaxID=2638111 RepID=UPI001BCDC8BD|nr:MULTISPECIES: ABC transporter substrate-binding protein [unclassified Chelatococcus]MBS7743703.1 ABC transporter substrate-binding protein [Chelatococcus sp. HY11]MBX3547395.1 ABC transporter substrate-binding protein [Chelatococcus sp.]CAH1664490.1 putative ABC transporter, substrate binding subunit [Hyphomicrobiales bacterium]CAH1688305.1 putative ABC transporter, substrate binding subunit [Hyphomicrobiales bacterium]
MFTHNRRSFLLGTVAAAGALAAPRGLHAAGPRHGGTLTLLTSDPPVILSLLNTGAASYVSGKVTEGLLRYEFDLTPKPELAIKWSLSPDGLVYSFSLRPQVKWHDGADFTSADVAFSIEAAKKYHPRGAATFANVVEVRTPDALTAEIVLSKPSPYIISALASHETPILPKHVYKDGPIDKSPNNNAPIGTGPFIFREWERGSHIVFERNPNYWDAPKPYLDRVIIRVIADAAARTIALETGEAQASQGSLLVLNDVARLQKNTALAADDNGNQYDNSITHFIFNLDRPHFKDVRVRRAVAHAVDREFILKNAWYGYGELSQGPLSPLLSRYYDKTLVPYAFDPKKAEALLDEAGFPRQADGVRFRITHDYMPTAEAFKTAAEYIKQALGAVGIAVTIRAQDFATYTRRVYTDRDFDLTYGFMSTTFDPSVGVQRLFWSKNFKPGVPFSNGAHYSNPEVDALLEAAAVEVDTEKRIEQFHKLQQIIHTDLPDLGILIVNVPSIFDKRYKNLITTADGLRASFADVYVES